MTSEQKAALDLAILNLRTHGDDQLLSAVKPLIEFYESRVLAERKEPIYQARSIGASFWTDQSKDGFDHMAKYTDCFETRIVFAHPTPDDAKDAERLDFVIENNAFIVWCMRDGSIEQCQLYKGDDDENIWPICGDARYFNTPREAIDAAIDRAMQDRESRE